MTRKEKGMRKIFGKQELKIIEKQLLGVSLSASEKTRLSRDIRPKFKIISELCDFKKEFELKKGNEIRFFIEEAKEVILESKWATRIKQIVLFGSFVENKLRLDSDIDISVKFDKIMSKEATKFRIEISARVSEKIDVQVFNVLPKKIQKEINEKGRVIYGESK